MTTYFELMRAQICYSILLLDGQNSDILSGTRQIWEHLLSLLLHPGLLKKISKVQQDLTSFYQNGTSMFAIYLLTYCSNVDISVMGGVSSTPFQLICNMFRNGGAIALGGTQGDQSSFIS